MRYAIVDENGMITNIIICESDEIAAQFSALPVREDLGIGDEYTAPISEPEVEVIPEATQLDRIEAQITYTAMMTGTLLEDDVYEEEN